MSATIAITRAGPLTTVQDAGRFGQLRHGISASGPMDGVAYRLAGALAGADHGGIEITMAGIGLRLQSGQCRVGLAGGRFDARHNGLMLEWPGAVSLAAGDELTVMPGTAGNYGYLRFDGAPVLPTIMGSLATSSRARLGGLEGRPLQVGDVLELADAAGPAPQAVTARQAETGPIRFVWGLHADLFASPVRQRFVTTPFVISRQLDRMGVRLTDAGGVFADATILSLASDAIVPGDIQILGDGTPIVLMRDHQPTGGYPRIGTIISADLDRFAQLRPGTDIAFSSVSVVHAQQILRSQSP
ncbi:biotin-dependent carboxyltransferase family protein [Devosia sp.]|uniref:5-oxoprolinase subunit C family protein n=1 Tax=Devosia sp. TaxID=1871048 RepID=UPI002736E898|nr:biotin-dependent carboxyltransferase family protein [Devosia sp.]MDP2781801.1 biotin-dependent carboxyltransferase family protein [Devosia sp.]